MKHVVMMTFPGDKYDVYGTCLRGAKKYWPEEVEKIAICERPDAIPKDACAGVTLLDFAEVAGARQTKFEERNKASDIFDYDMKGNISVQAAKFARKAHAQLHVLEAVDADVVWYIDADVDTLKPITTDFLDDLARGPHYLGCLPRWDIDPGYTETGFIMWKKCMRDVHQAWCNLYAECYDEDRIFEYSAWHDCIAFDHATKKLMQDNVITIQDFAFGIKSQHPLVAGPLGEFFDHLKGNRKVLGISPERLAYHGRGRVLVLIARYILMAIDWRGRIIRRIKEFKTHRSV